MIHLDPAGISPGHPSLGQRPGMDAGQPQTGTLLGEKAVDISGEISSLGDAAEEISLHMAEKSEDKHHAERKVKSERPPQLLQPAEIVEMLEQARDPDAQAKLDALAAESFGDVSKQYLALQYALRQGERENASAELLESLRDALADLEIESGPQIRAGLNTLRTAGEFAQDAQGVEAFQNTYRDIVLGENTLGKTLDLALQRFGGKDVARGLAQLVAALGQDLASARPSTEPSKLQALTADLYHLQVAVTVLEGCGELSARLKDDGLGAVDSERLMRDLVGITGEKWLSDSRFTTLATQHRVASVEGRIVFLTGVKTMLRELPVQVFPDPDARQSVLNAVQGALDIAIDEEDQQ